MAYVFPKAQIRKLNLYTHSSGDLVLTPENSGSVILLDNSSNLEVTLPGVANNIGLQFTFLVIDTAETNTVHIYSKDNTGSFETKIKRDGTDGTAYNTFKIVSDNVIGDKIEALCNGVNWFINVTCSTSSTYSLE